MSDVKTFQVSTWKRIKGIDFVELNDQDVTLGRELPMIREHKHSSFKKGITTDVKS